MSSLFSETSKIPKSGDTKRFFDEKLNSNYEMDSWVWIQGLNGAKELNGKLGQIVKYCEEWQCYQVFVPGHDSNGFSNFYSKKNWVSDAILAKKQDDAKIRKLFLSPGCHMKLIKPENLKVYEGNLVECQYVEPGHPFGRFHRYWYPREHPIFTVKKGNTPVLNRCGFPLIIVRYPDNCQRKPRSHNDNKFELETLYFANLLVDVNTGLIPPEWQNYVGPILAYRPQYHHILGTQIEGQSDVQHFNNLDVEIIWTFMSTIMISLEKTKIPKADRDPVLSGILDQYGEDEVRVANWDFTFELLRNFTENYCLNNTGLSQNYQGTEGQNITLSLLFSDPDFLDSLSDPEVAAAFEDIESNPANLMKYQGNPKVMKLLTKIAGGEIDTGHFFHLSLTQCLVFLGIL